jgi:hypothetical protein
MFENTPIKKLDQFRRFQAASIATPMTAELRPGEVFDPRGWGDFVILKPLSLTLSSLGNSARLFRTQALANLDNSKLSPDHILKRAPVLVQDFVDTGLYPSKWRVLSLFGEPLYSAVSRSVLPRADLQADDLEIEASVVEPRTTANKEADSLGERDALASDNDVLGFARRIHSAFPKTPLLGIDILRRESDAELLALEINAGGNVWHFSSYAKQHRARLGGKEAMIAQFGAWSVAAKILTRVVEKHAC